MPSYFDIYVISESRSVKAIEGFLEEFLPSRAESADEYEFPQYADSPDIVLKNAADVIEKCSKEKGLEYGVYWRANKVEKPEHAMVFFLSDGYVIYGLSTDDAYPDYANHLLHEMKAFLNSNLGYIGHEASPDVSNFSEFEAQVEAHKALTKGSK